MQAADAASGGRRQRQEAGGSGGGTLLAACWAMQGPLLTEIDRSRLLRLIVVLFQARSAASQAPH